jgi:site-specific DNA recombinase
MARSAFYLRRSSPGEEDKNYSLEEQQRDCQRWNDAEQHELIKQCLYSDPGGKSYTLNRPVFQHMLADAKAGFFDILVVGRYDRFSRNQDQQAVAIYQLEQYGVKVVSATEPVPDGVIGTFMRNTYAFNAELELQHIRARTTAGKKARMRNGKPLVGCFPLYGYQWADPHEPHGKSRYIPDPETAPVVRRIFAAVVTGMTLRQLANSLERDGIPTPGQIHQARGETKGRTCSPVWHLSGLTRILTNPAYIGKHSGWRHALRSVTVLHPVTGEPIERKRLAERPGDDPERVFFSADVCPPLVDEATFAAVQAVFEQNRRQAARNMRAPQSALLRSGFLRCGYCGRFMQPRRNPHRGNDYRYYCPSATGTKIIQERCGGRAFSIRCAEVDDLVWRWFIHAFENPDVLRKKFAQWKVEQEQGTALEYDRLQAIEAAIKKAEARKANYIASAGDTRDEELRAELIQHAEAAAKQMKELAQEQERLSALLALQNGYQERVENLIVQGEAALERLKEASYEDKRMALNAFKIQVKVWKKDHHPPFEISWAFDALHERWAQEQLLANCVSKHWCKDKTCAACPCAMQIAEDQ